MGWGATNPAGTPLINQIPSIPPAAISRRPALKVLLKHRHDEKCFAVEAVKDGRWDSPWVMDREPLSYLDTLGRHNGSSTRWLRMRCNDPKCEALALVLHDELAQMVEKALGGY